MNHRNLRTGRWGILWVSYLGIIAFALVFQSFSPVLDLMISGIGLTHGQAGALMSYFALPGILFSIPAGVLSDRYGARTVGLVSLILMTIGSALTAAGGDFLWLAAGRTIAGMGAFTLTVTLTQLISVWFKGRELGLAMGVYNTGMPLGTIIALNTLGVIGRAQGWHVSLAATAAVSMIALIAFYYVARVPAGADGGGTSEYGVRKREEGRRTREDGRKKTRVFPSALEIRQLGPGVWLVGVSWLWVNAAGISFLTFGTDYFLSRGESAAAAGLLTSFLMVGSVFLSPLAGFMIDRGWSQKAMIIVGSVLLGIVYVLIPQMKFNVYALTIVLGVAAALIPVAVFSLPARILPLRHVGLGFGIISACLNIGITIGPCMVGIARDLVGGYYTGFVMMAVFSFLSLAAIALLKIKNNYNRS
jgi:predicted MFS family arabinose efflux permease